ncbi:Hypothetical predicted protein, partial [Olea europaea subsp. europaea]
MNIICILIGVRLAYRARPCVIIHLRSECGPRRYPAQAEKRLMRDKPAASRGAGRAPEASRCFLPVELLGTRMSSRVFACDDKLP